MVQQLIYTPLSNGAKIHGSNDDNEIDRQLLIGDGWLVIQTDQGETLGIRLPENIVLCRVREPNIKDKLDWLLTKMSAEILAYNLHVTLATIKRWRAGGNISTGNWQKIERLYKEMKGT